MSPRTVKADEVMRRGRMAKAGQFADAALVVDSPCVSIDVVAVACR